MGLLPALMRRCGPALLVMLGAVQMLAAAASEPRAPYARGWSAAHADAHNSDYSPVVGARSLALAWQRDFGGTINLSPTTDGRRVYVTTSAAGCHLYVLDYATGDTLWCSAAPGRLAVSSSALLDAEGRIYVADDQTMYAFSAEGEILWRHPIIGFPLSAQFTPEGRLLFITHVGRIYVLDRGRGRPLLDGLALSPELDYRPGDDARACLRGTDRCPSANTPAIDARGRVYFTYWSPGAPRAGLRAMQYTEDPVPSLRPLWVQDELPGGSASSPDLSADAQRIYVTDNVDSLHALDATTGRRIWSHRIGYAPAGSPVTTPEGVLMPAGSGGAPLLALRDAGDHAELLWRNEHLQNRGIPTIAAGGLAYATVSSGRLRNELVVIDVLTGRVLDRDSLPGRTLFSVGTTLDENGQVYVPTFDGKLFTFRPVEPTQR